MDAGEVVAWLLIFVAIGAAGGMMAGALRELAERFPDVPVPAKRPDDDPRRPL